MELKTRESLESVMKEAITCDECKKEVDAIVQFYPGLYVVIQTVNDKITIWICKDCLKKALSLFPQESAKE